MTYVVETKSLTKYYGKSRGIIDINLQIQKGEVFGFIGPNGAGKSTFIRTILGLINATSGDVDVFGLDIKKDKKKILEQVGYLPSEVCYYDKMRAIDLLRYSESFYKKNCIDRIYELSERLELDLKKRIDSMSLGNKKKVGIIQGLIHSPKLIILDEPTSGLDPLMQKIFFEIISEENKRGATVLFSSHILSEVQNICDRVAIIKDGRIVKTQSVAELQTNSYKRVVITSAEQDLLTKLNLASIVNCEVSESRTSFMYNEDINKLIKALSNITIDNLEVSEPTLEEVFMHYYED